MADDIRLIRDEESPGPPEEKIYLWRLVGFDPIYNKLVFEDPRTGERRAYYGTTWAGASSDGVVVVELNDIVSKRFKYIDPGYK